ncbi:MAG: ankyrin repeat domain-containing protein [Simkaniaceae bacterium]|nr:ankyrin repeat domain-containing protein [Simkaniaceae bacterium]
MSIYSPTTPAVPRDLPAGWRLLTTPDEHCDVAKVDRIAHTALKSEVEAKEESVSKNEFVLASARGDKVEVMRLREKGTYSRKSVREALKEACGAGHVDVVKWLINEAHAFPSMEALIPACKGGHIDVVKCILDWGVTLNWSSSSGGDRPLIAAARAGHHDLVKFLLEQGADPNEQHGVTNRTALMCASELGYVEVVRTLLDKGAFVSLGNTDDLGDTALILAVRSGHEDVVRLLLDNESKRRGAHINHVNESGQWALGIAADKGYKGIVRLLLEKGADPNLKLPPDITTDGHTSLMYVARTGNEEIIEQLCAAGADLDTLTHTKYGESAFSIACDFGNISVVQLFLDKGILDLKKRRIDTLKKRPTDTRTSVMTLWRKEKEKVDQLGGRALMNACRQGHVAIVKLLLDQGVKAGYVDEQMGETPLTCACVTRHTAVVELLLRHYRPDLDSEDPDYFDINFRTVCDDTPLMLASERGCVEMIALLKKAGAKTDLTNSGGHTASQLFEIYTKRMLRGPTQRVSILKPPPDFVPKPKPKLHLQFRK